ncbi:MULTISPECIES: cupin domain-containing protein [Methylobacterium]|uniref:cupin domain-containing protein n=1 Tax=Methylobacterium TaxID=407 RepID=UPI003392C728
MDGRCLNVSCQQAEERTGPPRGWVILEGAPEVRSRRLYESDDGLIWAGEWTSTPGTFFVEYDKFEFIHMIYGSLVIEPELGSPIVLSSGDSFVIEPGFRGRWTVKSDMKKRYLFCAGHKS